MKKIKTLHILFPEKFFYQYIHFVNENFNPDDHLFLYLKTKGNEPQFSNVKRLKFYRFGPLFYWELFCYSRRSEKIILHSLSKPKVIYFLFLFPFFLKKCYWYLWGGDLYYRISQYSKPIYNPLSKLIFKSVVEKLGCIVSQIKGDIDFARQYFNFKGKTIDSFLYPSNFFNPLELRKKTDNTLWIQIGNSSHESNNHIDAINRISYLKEDDVKIICPLSYGNKKHAATVIKRGKEVFGDKFIPLTTFIPLEEYLEILSKIDIAIFNHWRQQAVGNITTLLGLGKTVYIRKEVTTWQLLEEKGIKILDFSLVTELLTLPESDRASNAEIIKRNYNKETLIKQSKEVFG